MAKRSSTKDTARIKAQEMRKRQEQKEKKTRAIIFATVGILLAAVVIAVIWVINSSRANEQEAVIDGDPKAIVVSSEGVGEADPGVPTVREYFDYSCHACANIDVLMGQQLWASVKAGDINLELMPVEVVKMPWHYAAAHAAYLISENEPEKFEQFHHSTFEFFQSQFNSGDGSVIQDEAASLKKVKELATEAGVSDSLVSQIASDGAKGVLQANTELWQTASVEGRDQLGTPEFVTHDKFIPLKGESAEELVQAILDAAKAE